MSQMNTAEILELPPHADDTREFALDEEESRQRALDHCNEMFAELSASFAAFVQILGEISDSTNPQDDTDVLKLYQQWIRTGSRSAARKLARALIQEAQSKS